MSVGYLEFESLQRPFGRVYRNSSRFTVSSSTPYRTFSLGRARRDRNVPNFVPFLKIFHNRISSNLCAGLNPLPRTIQGNDPGTTACPPCAS